VQDLPGAAQTGGLAIVGRAGVSPSYDVDTSLSTSLSLRGHLPNARRLIMWGGNSSCPASDQPTQLAVHPAAKTQVGTQFDADGHVPMMAANQYVFAGSGHLVAHRVVLASSHPLLRTAVNEGSSAGSARAKKNAPRGKGNPRGALRPGGLQQSNGWITGLVPILALLII
jgi:hypothetical protein